jgi:hypothetical protein
MLTLLLIALAIAFALSYAEAARMDKATRYCKSLHGTERLICLEGVGDSTLCLLVVALSGVTLPFLVYLLFKTRSVR